METPVVDYLKKLQNDITRMLQNEDPTVTLIEDQWSHQEGGGGLTRVFQGGSIIEKAGVNFSHVHGFKLPPAATERRPELVGHDFQATGVSVVIHPVNPYVPTTHANIRFLCSETNSNQPVWWFGGGFDMTPYYGFEEDAIHFHSMAKAACDPFGRDLYPRFKQNADHYFFLKHRNEPRGIGGTFFDDFNEVSFEHSFGMASNMGNHFIKAYQPIIHKRKTTPYSEREQRFQHYRRGRYVEFNLIYDRGTLFGLQSGGRTESILMSLPQYVRWDYNYEPEPETPEAKLYEVFLKPQDWVNYKLVNAQ